MHNRDKHPEIWKAKEHAERKLKLLMDERKAFTDEIGFIQDQINFLKQQKESLNDLAMQDAEYIIELRGLISSMAKTMGAVVANN